MTDDASYVESCVTNAAQLGFQRSMRNACGCLNYKVRIPNTDEFRDLQGIDPWYEGAEGKEGRLCQLGAVVFSWDMKIDSKQTTNIG